MRADPPVCVVCELPYDPAKSNLTDACESCEKYFERHIPVRNWGYLVTAALVCWATLVPVAFVCFSVWGPLGILGYPAGFYVGAATYLGLFRRGHRRFRRSHYGCFRALAL